MAGQITPYGSKSVDNIQYIAAYVPSQTCYVIARIRMMGKEARFDYAAMRDRDEFEQMLLRFFLVFMP